jgi:ribosomal protein S1
MKKIEFIKAVSEATGKDILVAHCYGDTVAVGFLNVNNDWVKVGIRQTKPNMWYSSDHLKRITEAVNNIAKQGDIALLSSELTSYQTRKQFKQ